MPEIVVDETLSSKIVRKECTYKNYSERFKPPNNNYSKQYYHIYLTRLENVRSRLLQRIEEKWGQKYPICRLGEISNQTGLCIVTGTIFKDQQLKPSILKELCEENQLIPQPHRTHFTDDSDILILEDELQRIHLHGGISIHEIVTGIPCAVLGTDIDLGQFKVEDYVFLNCPVQIERPIMEDDGFIVFISGLDLVNKQVDLLPFQLFIDWVIGLQGDKKQQDEIAKVFRVIIAGNSIRNCADTNIKKSLVSKNVETEDTFEAVKLLDNYLLQLSEYVNVDLMPGEFDPSNFMLPQQPLHYCMFPKSSKFSTLNSVSNPYDCEINGFRFLGTSGQPLHDIFRYSRIEDPVTALEQCIKWSHLCPTAPDTLSCYPYYNNDPFIISDCPHVIFAGNQSHFQTKTYNGSQNQNVLLVCIPEFSKTQTIVLLNLKNFECSSVSFKLPDKLN